MKLTDILEAFSKRTYRDRKSFEAPERFDSFQELSYSKWVASAITSVAHTFGKDVSKWGRDEIEELYSLPEVQQAALEDWQVQKDQAAEKGWQHVETPHDQLFSVMSDALDRVDSFHSMVVKDYIAYARAGEEDMSGTYFHIEEDHIILYQEPGPPFGVPHYDKQGKPEPTDEYVIKKTDLSPQLWKTFRELAKQGQQR